MNEVTCPSCELGAMEVFFEINSAPTNSCILLDSPEEARGYPRGEISLGFCAKCGFISNTSFDPRLTEYSGRYEETQGFSGTFSKFHRRLAERLIEKYDLRDKDILEVGCGKGEFITLLSELGNNRGTGFDPAYREERNVSEAAKRVRFVKDFFSVEHSAEKADFVCCKMTLEHIHRVGDFVGMIRNSIGDRRDTVVFFQIPDVTRILRDCAFEDIYYEHCSYFSPGSLARLFRASGFDVLTVDTEYDGQYLTIEAKPSSEGFSEEVLPRESDFQLIQGLVESFPERCREKQHLWRRRLDAWGEQKKRVVLWGSGSKGVSFLTSLDVGEQIEHIIDINPFRQGHYMSGTGQRIAGPDLLREYQPDIVVVMNAIYCEEIGRSLRELGVTAQIAPV